MDTEKENDMSPRLFNDEAYARLRRNQAVVKNILGKNKGTTILLHESGPLIVLKVRIRYV